MCYKSNVSILLALNTISSIVLMKEYIHNPLLIQLLLFASIVLIISFYNDLYYITIILCYNIDLMLQQHTEHIYVFTSLMLVALIYTAYRVYHHQNENERELHTLEANYLNQTKLNY